VKREISAVFTDFSVFSAFLTGSLSLTGSGLVSLIFTVSSVVSPISIPALAADLLSLPLRLLGPAPLLGPWWPLSTASGVLFLDIISSIPSGPQTKCWSHPLHVDKRV
jgi:hypothetical protein